MQHTQSLPASACLFCCMVMADLQAQVVWEHRAAALLVTFLIQQQGGMGSGLHRLSVCLHADLCTLLSAAEVREGLDVHFAETYEDVYQVAFEYDGEEAAQKVVPHSEHRLMESAAAA